MGDQQRAKSSLIPGTRFGRYEIITDIASGGMATVYLARALGAAGFQRLVAIKLMHPHYGSDDDFVAMFMDEARLAARIRHPNVVATLDLENDGDGLYLVMEYVEGDVLLGLLRASQKENKTVPTPIGLRIVLDMLNGLHAAHELTGDRGEPLRLVHRDVSPHNVLVGVDGIARITDFGIARAEERVGATRDGQVKGKLSYMAPEQTGSSPVDRRADLFATGVVLWETLAGKRLLHGQNDGEVLRKLLVNPIPRLKEVRPDLPAALDEVCARALERDPDHRWASASQFADALEEAGGSVGIASTRAVSQHVRAASGSKIAAMEQRVWGLSPLNTGASNSAVRPVRRREGTDPEQTVRRDEPPSVHDTAATTTRASFESIPSPAAAPGSLMPRPPAPPAAAGAHRIEGSAEPPTARSSNAGSAGPPPPPSSRTSAASGGSGTALSASQIGAAGAASPVDAYGPMIAPALLSPPATDLSSDALVDLDDASDASPRRRGPLWIGVGVLVGLLLGGGLMFWRRANHAAPASAVTAPAPSAERAAGVQTEPTTAPAPPSVEPGAPTPSAPSMPSTAIVLEPAAPPGTSVPEGTAEPVAPVPATPVEVTPPASATATPEPAAANPRPDASPPAVPSSGPRRGGSSGRRPAATPNQGPHGPGRTYDPESI